MEPELKNYYEILELTPQASQKDIRLAYLRLARLYHPDKNMNLDDSQMIELNQVYEVLSNPAKKKEYDQRFGITPSYDFTKTQNDPGEKPKREHRPKNAPRSKGISVKGLKNALWYILIACMSYLMLVLIVKILGIFTVLPDWIKFFIP